MFYDANHFAIAAPKAMSEPGPFTSRHYSTLQKKDKKIPFHFERVETSVLIGLGNFVFLYLAVKRGKGNIK